MSHVLCVTLMCDVSHSSPYSAHAHVPRWLIRMCRAFTHMHTDHDSFTCVTWLIHMCDVTHSHVWRDSFTCVTWLIHMCQIISWMSHTWVCHSFACVTHSFMCHSWATPSFWRDSFTCVTHVSLISWMSHTCECVCHSFTCVTHTCRYLSAFHEFTRKFMDMSSSVYTCVSRDTHMEFFSGYHVVSACPFFSFSKMNDITRVNTSPHTHVESYTCSYTCWVLFRHVVSAHSALQ